MPLSFALSHRQSSTYSRLCICNNTEAKRESAMLYLYPASVDACAAKSEAVRQLLVRSAGRYRLLPRQQTGRQRAAGQ